MLFCNSNALYVCVRDPAAVEVCPLLDDIAVRFQLLKLLQPLFRQTLVLISQALEVSETSSLEILVTCIGTPVPMEVLRAGAAGCCLVLNLLSQN